MRTIDRKCQRCNRNLVSLYECDDFVVCKNKGCSLFDCAVACTPNVPDANRLNPVHLTAKKEPFPALDESLRPLYSDPHNGTNAIAAPPRDGGVAEASQDADRADAGRETALPGNVGEGEGRESGLDRLCEDAGEISVEVILCNLDARLRLVQSEISKLQARLDSLEASRK